MPSVFKKTNEKKNTPFLFSLHSRSLRKSTRFRLTDYLNTSLPEAYAQIFILSIQPPQYFHWMEFADLIHALHRAGKEVEFLVRHFSAKMLGV